MLTHGVRRAMTLSLALALACKGSKPDDSGGEVSRTWNPSGVESVKGVPAPAIRAELQRQLATKPDVPTAEQWRHTQNLYKRFSPGPLWLDRDGLIKDRASALIDALVNATSDAINLDQYPLVELAYALDTVRRVEHPSPAQLARADLLLTVSYAALSEDYLRGQIDPATVSQSWHINREDSPIDSAMARSLRDADMARAIARMRPDDADYEMLRRKLTDYRKFAATGGWPTIPPVGAKPLKVGGRASPALLQALRTRLRVEGYQLDSAASFDASIAGAIADFQRHHGIGVDSMLGQETVDALNVSPAMRAAQIAANLERRRWMPRSLGARYIFVNVPAFQLQAFDGGSKSLEMKVIVGAEYEGRATPVFSDSMEYVIFRPYWDVPPSIAEKELIPKGIPADFEQTTQGGQLHFRQRPGPRNALGLVKFMFPNDFNIYLHDTPQDNLFDKDVRAFSHGCIRLEKPDELAAWVLGWPIDRVHSQMNEGPDDHQVNLSRKVPVYIGYYTAYMRDGELWFGNDLYHRDDDLIGVISGGAFPTGHAVQAIKVLRDLTD
jgi:murein L,D-transpeptidase YcbB/YkuD